MPIWKDELNRSFPISSLTFFCTSATIEPLAIVLDRDRLVVGCQRRRAAIAADTGSWSGRYPPTLIVVTRRMRNFAAATFFSSSVNVVIRRSSRTLADVPNDVQLIPQVPVGLLDRRRGEEQHALGPRVRSREEPLRAALAGVARAPSQERGCGRRRCLEAVLEVVRLIDDDQIESRQAQQHSARAKLSLNACLLRRSKTLVPSQGSSARKLSAIRDAFGLQSAVAAHSARLKLVRRMKKSRPDRATTRVTQVDQVLAGRAVAARRRPSRYFTRRSGKRTL